MGHGAMGSEDKAGLLVTEPGSICELLNSSQRVNGGCPSAPWGGKCFWALPSCPTFLLQGLAPWGGAWASLWRLWGMASGCLGVEGGISLGDSWY